MKNDLNEDLIEYLTATNATVVIFITAIHTVFVRCMYFFWSSTLRGLSAVAEELRPSLPVDKGTVRSSTIKKKKKKSCYHLQSHLISRFLM